MVERHAHFTSKFYGLSWCNAAGLFLLAWLLRSILFFSYLQHELRFQQPDSPDYHTCALAISSGKGMFNPTTGEPIFWRTPGYPWFLSLFYVNTFNLSSINVRPHSTVKTYISFL